MDEGHLCVSTRLLGLPAEEQSAGCSGLLPPPQSCRYSLVAPTLAPPHLTLYVSALSVHAHTYTQDMHCHTLTVSHICSFDRMGRALLRTETRLLSRYTNTHIHSLTHAKTPKCDSTFMHLHSQYMRVTLTHWTTFVGFSFVLLHEGEQRQAFIA